MKNNIFIVFVFFLTVFGCKKSPGGISCSSGIGGTGGKAVLNVTAEHSNIFIDTCTVYIKYGSCDAPSNGVYDDSAVLITVPGDTVANARFMSLMIGNYYLYGIGYHSGYNLKGGAPCTINSVGDSLNVVVPTYPYY